MNSILSVEKLVRTFKSGNKEITVVNNLSFDIQENTSCAIIGPSGSGKTTLLGLCAGLDRPNSGSVFMNGIQIDALSEDERAIIRNKNIGFIFQTFQLIPTLTALENVMVPLELRGESSKSVRKYAEQLLLQVGLGERGHHYPSQLSGGEQQRVAIARAFINEPKILFADEPTGNLDTKTGLLIENLIFDLNKKLGTTLIMVTHNPELANKCDRVLTLKNGTIVNDTQNKADLNG